MPPLIRYYRPKKEKNTVKAGELNQSHIGKRFKEIPGRVQRVNHLKGTVKVLSSVGQIGWHTFWPDFTLEPEPEYETVAAGELRPEHIGRQMDTGQCIRAIVFTSDQVALNLGTTEGHRYKSHDLIRMMVED